MSQILTLQVVARSLPPAVLQSAGIDVATLQTLAAITANIAAATAGRGLSTDAASAPSVSPSLALTASLSSSSSAASMSHHASDSTAYLKRERDGDTPSSSGSKRSRHHSSRTSHASSPSSPDGFSPRRRRSLVEDGEADGLAGSGDESESDVSQTTSPGPLSPLSSSQAVKRRSEEEKAVNEQQRKRQHQKSDKQRRAKIKDGMEQLKALVSLHGRLESPDQASIVSASVDLVHALRTEIACLKQEVERARGENASMRGGRGGGGYGGLDGVSLLRGGLGNSAALSSSLSQLSQLSSLSQLNSSLSSLSASSLSGLNALNNLSLLSSLGLPTNINAALPAPQMPAGGGGGGGLHSPMPLLPMGSPPPLSMPSSNGSIGSNGFTQYLTSSPPGAGIYGKDWQ